MLLRHYLEAGVSKAELARRFGVSRRTIHRWVESGQLDRELSSGPSVYSPRPRVMHKLDPYKALIELRLAEFPKLSAQRLFDEVRAAGYEGSYSRVRDHVREVRPRERQEPVVRFERDERQALHPLALAPYRRLGSQPSAEPSRPVLATTVHVQRRPLREYTEAVS